MSRASNGRVVGILTKRDLRFQTNNVMRIKDVMTRELVTARPGTGLEQAQEILHKNKVEKLLLVDDSWTAGWISITIKDIDKILFSASRTPAATKKGRLRVGAAVGVHDEGRVEALLKAGVDVLVVDTVTHGHSSRVIDTVKWIKKSHPHTEVIASETWRQPTAPKRWPTPALTL